MTFLTFRVIFFSALTALILGQICYRLALKWGIVDIPNLRPHKAHLQPVPLAGGWVIFLTVLAAGTVVEFLPLPAVYPILLSSIVVFIFGLWDDIVQLTVPYKLLGQIVGSILLIYMGVQVRLFSQEWLNWLITMVWVVGITNAFNFVDSMDGLATGLGAMAAAFFMLVTFDSEQIELSLLSAVLLGACIGSFYYNSMPAKYFLGDSGSQLLGFILAGLAIAYNPLGFQRVQSWFIPILLVGVPIFDTVLVVFSRLRRSKPIYLANLDHTYHRLVSYGMNSNRAVVTMHTAALLLGCLAFILLSLHPLVSNTIFVSFVVLGGILILYLDRTKP
jgi:UDP-GlcNAc:undecaprenyl-phosphate/decaprenyl-phosphate GlcNAc-1-phosphate transferase